ncbi:MAG TPA: ATP-binding cassette domain-containing protein [Candidatus Eisenbacteria bacterium]|nr:ATP-binding cassette domain-containing protein [Candidatus Eisenbacteria bacterium]
MLSVENLMVFYENGLAVNNVSLEVREREVVGLLGSNGAGKSTLMYTISGIMLDRQAKEQRRGGEKITVLGGLRYRGEEIGDLKASLRVKKGIVLCPERRRVFSESTVLENLKIGATLRKTSEARASLERVWQLFPVLFELRHRTAGFLSGGEQQMLAIGRALMAGPSLLLLDEPLLGLAPALQLKVVQAVRSIAQSGITVLVADQYARPLLPIIDRGYVIESGSIVVEGTGQTLLDNPHVRSAYFGM